MLLINHVLLFCQCRVMSTIAKGFIMYIYLFFFNLDFWSWRALEVVRSLEGDWQDSLFGALRHTRTPAGTRKLRATLLQVKMFPMYISYIFHLCIYIQLVNINFFPCITLAVFFSFFFFFILDVGASMRCDSSNSSQLFFSPS